MEKLIVPRLENLAFNASFEEILSNLALSSDHRPEGKELRTVTFSSALSSIRPLFTSQNLIKFVSNRLDYFLVGTMNDEIRKKLLEKFYGDFSKFQLNDNSVDLWVFMDCVLDDTIQALETHVSLNHSEPDLKLIPTITKQCSQLQKLKLDFSYTQWSTVDKLTPFITSLSSLQNLSSLNLYQMDSSHKPVLKLIGKSCPLLSHLNISGFHFSPRDILSIILGEFAGKLFPPYEETIQLQDLKYLNAPIEVLTPACFTLRQLILGTADWDSDSDGCSYVATFILHHLPLLEKMNGLSTTFGVNFLNNVRPSSMELETVETVGKAFRDKKIEGLLALAKMEVILENEQKKKFESACNEFVYSRSMIHPPPQFILRYPTFPGFVSLTRLDFVWPNSSILLKISKFCPNLKDVVFWEKLTVLELLTINLDLLGKDFKVISPPNEVAEHLKSWPQIETITIIDMSPEYVKVILKAFSNTLKSATFISCKNINVVDLIPCTQLENLRVLKSSSLVDTKLEPSLLSPDSFLPHLNSFVSEICLNLWTFWLEEKTELTHVVLNCCNNYTKASIHFDWNTIPKMWPKIETLHVRQCEGLTLSMVSSTVSQLSNLKELSLPEEIIKSDTKLAIDIWEEFSHRSAPARLLFTKGRCGKRCTPLWSVDEESTDSEDTEEENSDDDDEDPIGDEGEDDISEDVDIYMDWDF